MQEKVLQTIENLNNLPEKEKVKEMANMMGMEVTEQDINHATMSDEELDNVCNVLRDHRDPVMEQRMDFDSEEYNEYIEGLQESNGKAAVGTVLVNPENGASMITSTSDIEEEDDETEEIDLVKMFDDQKEEINIELCRSTFVDIYGITDETEQQVLFDAIMDVDNANFDELPQTIRTIILTASNTSIDKKTINEYTKFLLNNMKTDIITNKAVNIDLDKEMNRFREESNKIIDNILEENRNLLEKELAKQADELEAKGFKLKAKKCRVCSDAFRYTYTFEPLYREWKTLKIKGRKVSIKTYLDNELRNYMQHVTRFNNRYATINKNIHSCKLIAPALRRHLPKESEDNIKKFVILFCMYCSLLDPKKWEDHIYMYYSIYNIVSLDAVTDKSHGIANEILINVQKLIDEVIK